MGGFYGGIHILADDRKNVIESLNMIADNDNRMLIGDSSVDLISVYPVNGGQDERLAERISGLIDAHLIHIAIHDDDVLFYSVWKDGALIDRYSSSPDYFGKVSNAERERLSGNPSSVLPFLNSSDGVAIAAELLEEMRQGMLFQSDAPKRFGQLLGIEDIYISYEYLLEEGSEADGYLHLPDLGDEKKKKADRRKAITAKYRELKKNGSLLFEKKGSSKVRIPSFPVFSSDNRNNGFFASWSGQELSSIERLEDPWKRLEPSRLEFDDKVYCMATSKSGRFLSAGHAFGLWQTTLCDLDSGSTTVFPQRQTVSWVGFTNDESKLLSLSADIVSVIDIGTASVIAEHPIDALQAQAVGAIHPDGNMFVVGSQNGIDVHDMESGEKIATFAVVRTDPMILIRENIESLGIDLKGINPDELTIQQFQKLAVEQAVKQFGEEFAEHAERMGNARMGEHVRKLEFSEDGSQLYCATSAGVRVYHWLDVLQPGDSIPIPFAFTDAMKADFTEAGMGMNMAYTYAQAYDAKRQLVWFGGLDGRICVFDPKANESRVVLELPDQASILHMCLNTDSSAIACSLQPDFFAQGKRPSPVIRVFDCEKNV